MKGKKILTLVSAAMGLAIVGSTFAAWAVTDNADPFGIKVSPGQVGPDTTQFVTLSYGSDSTFANVNNLEAGVPRIAGSITLKADTNDGETFPYALFDIELQDQSNTKGVGEAKLVDYLQVDVYDEAVEIKNNLVVKKGTDTPAVAIGHIPTEDDELEASIHVTIPSGEGLKVYVVVSLDADLDAKILEEIAEDVVYLQMNLNKDPEQHYAEASSIYVNKGPETGEKVYCYAWSASNKNAAWPGVEMTASINGSYVYELNNVFDKVIFHSAKETTEGWASSWQTVDLDVTATIRSTTPMFTPNGTDEGGKLTGSWGAAPNPEIVPGYYVVSDKTDKGEFYPVKDCLMTVDSENAKHYTKVLDFVAGEKFKVCNQNRTVWYSSITTWDGCGFTIDEKGNLVVTTAGTYTVNLYIDGIGENCVTIEPKGA